MRNDAVAPAFNINADVDFHQLHEILHLGYQLKVSRKVPAIDRHLDILGMAGLGLLVEITLIPVAGIVAVENEMPETKHSKHHNSTDCRGRAAGHHVGPDAQPREPCRLLGPHIGVIPPDIGLLFQEPVQGCGVAHRGGKIDYPGMGIFDKVLDMRSGVQ